MNREVHVRICGSRRVRLPPATRPAQGPAIRAAGDCHRQAGQLSGRCPRAFAVGDPSPLEVPQQPGRELPSADQGPGTGDETLRLAWAGPTVPVCVRQHPRALSAPSSSDQRARMANRDDQPFRGLEPDHYRRSGLKDAVSHYLSPPNPLTSTAPQPFPNNLTMPSRLNCSSYGRGWRAAPMRCWPGRLPLARVRSTPTLRSRWSR